MITDYFLQGSVVTQTVLDGLTIHIIQLQISYRPTL